ncbi:MAG: M61 family metallopeptidase [Acidobacteriota bacterium]|nr:M61 family metallopeptidase [Acidobacteriota bacterium]
MKTTFLALCLVALGVGPAFGQTAASQPQPLPMPAPVPAPQDRPYPGTIHLAVDATDTAHHVFSVHETIPVAAAGPMILLYPQWIPGHHSPNGPLQELAGLVFHANGKRIPWTRDPVNVFAFHITLPEGAKTVEADFQQLTPVQPRVGRITMTHEMFDLEWNGVALYPAGYFSRDIRFEPSLKVRTGWKAYSALEPASTAGDTTTFKPVPFNTLVDSPVYGGHYSRRFELSTQPVPVWLDVVADRPDELDASPEAIDAHRALVAQAYKLYGSHHYDHYDFLLSLSDRQGGIGLEHHRSSEDGTSADYFTNWANAYTGRDLLAHEYTHSWNGKFRRPADLWTPNFNVPMRDSLLWVYEGQTQYWGYVLAARAGLWTKQQALDAIASVAATYDHRIGRTWRQLEDTTNDPIIANRRPLSWLSWQRSEDYYSEGQLIWLDADTLIRQLSNGTKSLDDFAKAFFGVDNGSYVTKTYTFDDVVHALNAVQPYDWATFLRSRLEGHGPGAPLAGLTRGGYRLGYSDTPTPFFRTNEMRRHITDLSFSIGATLTQDGTLMNVMWDGAVFKAGLTDGARVLAVNGQGYTADRLKAAIAAAKGKTTPIELSVENGERYFTVRVDYHGGLRYPHLERIAGTPDRLGEILTPKP